MITVRNFTRTVNALNVSTSLTRNIHCIPRSRKCISVHGEGSKEFLQNLITNNVNHLSPTSPAVYTLFLNPPGRFLFDAFLYKHPDFPEDDQAYLLDTASSDTESIMKYLNYFKLSSKITLEIRDDYQVNQWLPRNAESVQQLSSLPSLFKQDIVFHQDTRLPGLGWRSVAKESHNNEIGALFAELNEQTRLLPSECTLYDKYRSVFGIPEGGVELQRNKGIPLEASLHHFHAISWKKGCYVGQEFISRVYHKGEVRKSIVGFSIADDPNTVGWLDAESVLARINNPGANVPEGKEYPAGDIIVTDQGKQIGKIHAQFGSVGLAMLRLEELHQLDNEPAKFVVKSASDEYTILPIKPQWWK